MEGTVSTLHSQRVGRHARVVKVVPEVEVRPRDRARGRGRGRGRMGRPSKTGDVGSEFKIPCMTIPVTDEDDVDVECKLCCTKMTFREFRLHNMKEHCNIATTTDDPTMPEQKFYEKRLREFSKFTKPTSFNCPVRGCASTYKSILGLAYHLETCGKTREEIELCLLECEVCGKKLNRPNMIWHKKTHKDPPEGEEETVRDRSAPASGVRLKSRKSAIRARKVFSQNQDDDEELDDQTQSQNSRLKKGKRTVKDSDGDYTPVGAFDIEFVGKERRNHEGTNKSPARPPRPYIVKSDFSTGATAFITSPSNSSPSSFWSKPQRSTIDPLESVTHNLLIELERDDIIDHLPSVKESVMFKTVSESYDSLQCTTKDFRKLSWFEGEVVDNLDGNLVFNAGGPVLGLSWHPNGKVLAVSTARQPFENIDYKVRQKRKSCIQIYSHYYTKRIGRFDPVNSITLQLIICCDYGYATHIQWCNFWPECWDNYNYDNAIFTCENKLARLGHLACCFEDGTLRIFSISVSDFSMPGTFLSGINSDVIPVYKKAAEICLQIDSTVYPNAGQICKFDWHEDNKLLAVAFYGGIVAIFDVQTTSSLLVETVNESTQSTTVINPFWCFQAHLGPIMGISFDPMSPRYFVTGSKDRNLKLWDLHLRQEIESRKIGLIHDICWIRGWINVAVAVDACISSLSSQHNFVRFYQLGTSQPRPNCAEFMDVSSLTFHEGITIQGTESGNITSTYFDNFWREMDFDRNKKKQNVVNICKITTEPSSFTVLTKDDFSRDVSTRKKFEFKEETPRVVLTFFKERMRSILPDPKPQFFEDYIRFMPYLRINKVTWCPLGGCFAVGYRSGLLTVIPATFNSLYG